MNPFLTPSSTSLPEVIKAAQAMHAAVPIPQPPLTDTYNMTAPATPRFKTLLNIPKERFGD